MEKTISFKLQMYDKTDFVLVKYESVWAAKPAFKENVVLFRESKDLVYENEGKQTKSASSSGSKIMARDNMLNLAQLVCNLGITYASSTSDKELMPKFNFSPSELKEGLEKEVSKRCDDISKAALPILDKLIDLGNRIHIYHHHNPDIYSNFTGSIGQYPKNREGIFHTTFRITNS